MKSAEEIYGTSMPELPPGTRIIGFGYPKLRDYFLSSRGSELDGVRTSELSQYHWLEYHGPRFILDGPGVTVLGSSRRYMPTATGRLSSSGPNLQNIPFIRGGSNVAPVPTPESVYAYGPINIPEGYVKGEFRKVKPGELFLSDCGFSVSTATATYPSSSDSYRYVILPLTPNYVYGSRPVTAPKGFILGEFRKPKVGELFLSNSMQSPTWANGKNLPCLTVGQGYRYIVTPAPTPKIIRVVRVLEYVGPEDWIEATMKKNGVGPAGIKGPSVMYRPVMTPDRNIRELSIFKEEVK